MSARQERSPVPPGIHAEPVDLELYVMDALEPAARRRFERHVQACVACGRALAKEASREEDLRALWPRVTRPLAEVVPLRPRAVAPPAVAARRAAPFARLHLQGGLAAALVALFVSLWTDGGWFRAPVAPPTRPVTLAAACFAHGLSSLDGTGGGGLCQGSGAGAPWALASWGMCAGPARGVAGGDRCSVPSDEACSLSAAGSSPAGL